MADAGQGAEIMEPSSSTDEVTDINGGVVHSTENSTLNDTATVAEAAVEDSLWVRKWDEASNQLYYFNLRTQESSWDEPAAYKAVLISEPINLDTERAQTAEATVHDPQQDEEQQSSASVAIQSLYRGRKDRKRVEEARKWTEQFDPTTAQKYYYNSDTGESQWEKPVDFLVGIKDERSARAVKIQSVFRAKKARDRVKQLADEEEEEEDLKQQVRDVDEAVAAEEKKLAILTAERSVQEQWCEYYDPRSRKYYYRHSGTNEITWEKPEKYVSSSAEGSSKRDVAALSIQCAARKRIAANEVASKREKLRVLTDPVTMQLKLDELKQVSVEIQTEIDSRTLISVEEELQFPHLFNLLSGWSESLESIKNLVVSLENRGEDIIMAGCLAARLDHAERFHKSLAEVRSECLAVLRSILLMNSYFVDLDVSRINAACATFIKWKSHELCALKDFRLLEIFQGGDISVLLERAESLLRDAMGLADFTTGTTSTTGKRYEDWHPSVAAALVSICELEESLTQKTQLLRGYRTAEARKKEISQMAEEDLLAARLVQMQRRRLNDEKDHAIFLAKCQELWKKGLDQREEDLKAALERSKKLRRPKHHEVPQIDLSSGTNSDSKAKLSLWEATKEGLPVEAVRALVFAEMQKARRLGYDFLVKTARSDHGETLIQIACWWGHEHLVRFFLEEGAQVDGVDSTCNRFSLLHDSARRGHSQVVRLLLEHGISCTVTDNALDTPFHWAARKNNFSTVLILLGVYLTERGKARTDEIVKAVRSKNLRGKTASALAKGERLRNTLKAAEEGRLPPLRRPRPASGISRRMTEVGTRSSTKKGKTMLHKARKHGSALDIDELVSLTIFSQRLQPQALQRLSVAEILRDASALAIMQEEIPSMDNFRVLKQQKPCFGRMLKFLHMNEPTGYERDQEHKRLAMRYLALRTMLQLCNDIKISSIQEVCLSKVLRWFEATETNYIPARVSTPILPPRMSPKRPVSQPAPGLDKCISETNIRPTTSTSVSTKLEKYKMPDLRASHIRRIAELRSRGEDVPERDYSIEEDNNVIDLVKQDLHRNHKEDAEKRLVAATFKLYHPETVAEREMNLLWIRRRQEEENNRKNDAEVQQRVQSWAMDRSRDESENLRKRESTKLVAGLGQMLQEGVNQEKPFAQRSTETLHPDLAGMAALSNQSAVVVQTRSSREEPAQDKLKIQRRTSSKQPAQILVKSRKPTSSGGGMHFRNHLPANYVPPGLAAASSVPKTKREVSTASLNLRSSGIKESSNLPGGLERRTSAASEELSSASENEEEGPASDDSVKRKRSENREQMRLQSFHIPYYYSEGADHSTITKKPTIQKPHPRGTIPTESLPADPELRCLQEASALRRVFAIQLDKKNNPTTSRDVEVSSSRNSGRSQAGNSSRGPKSSKGKRPPKSSRSAAVLPRTISSYNPLESQLAASTSDLRQSQMEEMEKIRRLFEENHLTLDPQVLERGLLVPEDRPLLETIQNLPFAGSRLLVNPLTHKSKTAKAKKKTSSSKKKKTKKGKKSSKSSSRTSTKT